MQQDKTSDNPIDQLFKNHNISINEYIELLEKLKLVQFVSLRSYLMKMLGAYQQNDSDFDEFSTFKDRLLEKIRQSNLNPSQIVFPIIKGNESIFFKRHIRIFVASFLSGLLLGSKQVTEQQNRPAQRSQPSELSFRATASEHNLQASVSENNSKGQASEHKSQILTNLKVNEEVKSKSSQQYESNKTANIINFDDENIGLEDEVLDPSERNTIISDSSLNYQQKFYTLMKRTQICTKKTQKQKKDYQKLAQSSSPTKSMNQEIKVKSRRQVQEQISGIQENVIELSRKYIPKFFEQNPKTLSNLLAIQLTQFFQTQLKQIKENMQKLITNGVFTIKFYQEFIRQYYLYFQIQHQDLKMNIPDKQKRLRQISQYAQQQFVLQRSCKISYPYSESVLMETWKQICEQIKSRMNQKPSPGTKQIRVHLLNALKDIQFTFKYNRSQEALTYDQRIYINLNKKPNNLPLQKYRDKTMKAYIMLCLFHEFAHYLVRSIKHFNLLGDSRKSFDSNHMSLSSQIVEKAKLYFYRIPKYLHTDNVYLGDDSPISQIFDPLSQIAKDAINIVGGYQQIVSYLRKQASSLDYIQKQVQALSLVAEKSFNLTKDSKKQIRNKWAQLYKYIDLIVERAGKDSKKIIFSENQLNYRVFFSLFSLEYIVKIWLQGSNHSIQEYRKYLSRLQQFQIQNYYIQENELIDDFINDIKMMGNRDEQDIFFKLYQLQFGKDKFKNIIQVLDNIRKKFQPHQKSISALSTRLDEFFSWQRLKILPNFKIKDMKSPLKILFGQQFAIKHHEVFKIFQGYIKLTNLLKLFQLISIKRCLPSFLFEPTDPQSGFIVQRRIFPGLAVTNNLYAKDYNYMIKIDKNPRFRFLVGQMPLSEEEKDEVIKNIYGKFSCRSNKDIGDVIHISRQRHGTIKRIEKKMDQK